MLTDLRAIFGTGRRVTALGSAVVVLAALVAFSFAVPSQVRPQTAAAQGVCSNGGSQLFNPGCSTSPDYCNGYSSISVAGNCPATGSSYECNGVQYASPVQCSTGESYSCNGVEYAYPVSCPTTASSHECNGVQYATPVECSTGTSYSCNGVDYGYPVSCPTTASSYECNGVQYATLVECSTGTSSYECNGVGYSNPVNCPAAYTTCANGEQVLTGQECPASITVSTAYPPVTTGSYAFGQGFSVTYAAGWNIVAGPNGSMITGNVGPLYSFRPGDTTYEVAAAGSPLTAGSGAWAYFNANTTTTIAMTNPGSMSVQLPAGQFVMIGNPGDTTATVSGADAVLVYNPSTQSYNQTTQLAPGQGAWAISMRGGEATDEFAVVSVSLARRGLANGERSPRPGPSLTGPDRMGFSRPIGRRGPGVSCA